jgi:hypothetical protein
MGGRDPTAARSLLLRPGQTCEQTNKRVTDVGAFMLASNAFLSPPGASQRLCCCFQSLWPVAGPRSRFPKP